MVMAMDLIYTIRLVAAKNSKSLPVNSSEPLNLTYKRIVFLFIAFLVLS